MTVYVEGFAGTASVALWVAADRRGRPARVRPLTGYMGSKRSDAPTLAAVLGFERQPPSEIHLCDAGPWGDVWTVLQDREGREAAAAVLREWDQVGSLPEVWPHLLWEPSEEPGRRVAQYLCLQARAAGCIPVWWNPVTRRWESPSGSRTEVAHQRGGCDLASRQQSTGKRFAGPAYAQGVSGLRNRMKTRGVRGGAAAMKPVGRKVGKLYRSHPARGLVRIATLADRIDALDRPGTAEQLDLWGTP